MGNAPLSLTLRPTAVQVLSWLLQRNIVVIPKSASDKRMLQNLSVPLDRTSQEPSSEAFLPSVVDLSVRQEPTSLYSWQTRSKGLLSAEDMANISALDRGLCWFQSDEEINLQPMSARIAHLPGSKDDSLRAPCSAGSCVSCRSSDACSFARSLKKAFR